MKSQPNIKITSGKTDIIPIMLWTFAACLLFYFIPVDDNSVKFITILVIASIAIIVIILSILYKINYKIEIYNDYILTRNMFGKKTQIYAEELKVEWDDGRRRLYIYKKQTDFTYKKVFTISDNYGIENINQILKFAKMSPISNDLENE